MAELSGKSESLRQYVKDYLDNDITRLNNISSEEAQLLISELGRCLYELERDRDEKQKELGDALALRDKYQILYDNAPVAFLTINSKGTIIHANLTASEMFGVEPGRLLQKELIAFAESSDACRLYEMIRNLFSGRKPEICCIRFRKKNELPFYGRIQTLVENNSDGFSQVQLAITDIEKIKSLEQNNEQLAQLTEYNLNAVMQIASTGKVLYANPASKELLELWDAEVNQSVSQDMKYLIAEVYVSGQERVVEEVAAGRFYAVSIIPMVNKNYVNIYAYDVTDRKLVEKLERQHEQMIVLGQIAGGIGHNFNNQLTGIIGFADMLILKEKDEQLISYAKKIKAIALKSAEVTKQLLAFARVGCFQPVLVDIHKLINDVIVKLKKTVAANVNINCDLKSTQSCVLGDLAHLQNALFDVAANGCEAMPDGGELVFTAENIVLNEEASGKVQAELLPGHYAVISVSDTGGGIANGIKKQVFEPFFTTKEFGKGMGLSSTYGILKRHAGAIAFTSEEEQGTSFKLYLPLLKTCNKSEISAVLPDYSENSVINVLLIDDDPIICDVVTDLLENRGFRVVVANNGQEGVDIYKKSWQNIDLIILDMIMPVMGGDEALVELNKINPELKVIISSGYNVSEDIGRRIENGVVTFLYKPYSEYELILKIEDTLSVTLNFSDHGMEVNDEKDV